MVVLMGDEARGDGQAPDGSSVDDSAVRVYCAACGGRGFCGARYCGRCGSALGSAAAEACPPATSSGLGWAFAITSVIFGVIGLPFFILMVPSLGSLVLGVAALITLRRRRTTRGRKVAITGTALGAIVIVPWSFLVAWALTHPTPPPVVNAADGSYHYILPAAFDSLRDGTVLAADCNYDHALCPGHCEDAEFGCFPIESRHDRIQISQVQAQPGETFAQLVIRFRRSRRSLGVYPTGTQRFGGGYAVRFAYTGASPLLLTYLIPVYRGAVEVNCRSDHFGLRVVAHGCASLVTSFTTTSLNQP